MNVYRFMVHLVVLAICLDGCRAASALAADSPLHAARHANIAVARADHVIPLVYVGRQRIRTPALIERNRVFVPLRGVFEAIGASVQYAPPHFIVVRKDGAVIAGFTLNRPHAIVGRRLLDLDVAPLRRSGRVFVPLRVVAQAAGAGVSYTQRPPTVRIWPRPAAAVVVPVARDAGSVDGSRAQPEVRSNAMWLTGVAVVSGACLFACVVMLARRSFARHPAPSPRLEARALSGAAGAADVAHAAEARMYKRVVTERRTVEVVVSREELVIEHGGCGGTVVIDGRALEAGEVVRIPLWEERVDVTVSRHTLSDEVSVQTRRLAPPHANGRTVGIESR